jgi:hypothetical protein
VAHATDDWEIKHMGAVVFWIAVAAVLVAGNWRKKNIEGMRHETLRMLIQKEAGLNPAQVNELLNPPPPPLSEGHPWARRRDPAERVRNMRIAATLLVIAGPGVGGLIASLGLAHVLGFAVERQPGDSSVLIALGIGVAVCLVLLGVALFVAARYVRPAPNAIDGTRAA